MKTFLQIIVLLVLNSLIVFKINAQNNFKLISLNKQLDTNYKFNITITDSFMVFCKNANENLLNILISDTDSKMLKDFIFDTDSLFLELNDFDKEEYLINVLSEDFKWNNLYQLKK